MNLLKKRIVQLRVPPDGGGYGQVTLGASAGPEMSGRVFVGGQTFELEADRAEAVLAEIAPWVEVVEPDTEERG